VSGARRTAADDRAYVVGVTGGVASGKSTFVERLVAGGPARVVDADREGHAVLDEPEVAQALVAEFGAEILDGAGRVARGPLGARAFASDAALARLNAIVHPPLLARIARRVGALAEGFEGVIAIDAALLVEWDAGRWCDRVIAVLASPDTQVERLVRDRGWAAGRARDLVARQLPNDARAAYADAVVWNDGARDAFERAADAESRATWSAARAELAGRLPPATGLR
jgi:dephospho-CoA kinase